MEKALIGGGCFWGIEEYFRLINGVNKTQVGYSGGQKDNPTYQEVCSGNTRHAEVVLIDFDEKILSYKNLINHFWQCHDPTQLNKQGLDIGSQYRSIILYYSMQQKEIAETSKTYFQKNLQKRIVTEIIEAKNFYLAEDYHQCYIQKQKSI